MQRANDTIAKQALSTISAYHIRILGGAQRGFLAHQAARRLGCILAHTRSHALLSTKRSRCNLEEGVWRWFVGVSDRLRAHPWRRLQRVEQAWTNATTLFLWRSGVHVGFRLCSCGSRCALQKNVFVFWKFCHKGIRGNRTSCLPCGHDSRDQPNLKWGSPVRLGLVDRGQATGHDALHLKIRERTVRDPIAMK